MIKSPKALANRTTLLFSLLLAFNTGIVHAQQTITYNNGDNDSTGIVITSATNPTTLTISSGSATQSGPISESGGSYAIDKTGMGLLTLTSTNTYSGVTTISAGTLAIGTGGSIADSSEVDLSVSGSTFDISNGGSQTIQNLNGVSGSTVNLGANALSVASGGTGFVSGTFAGTIEGAGGSLVVSGTRGNGLFLTGTNTYTGGTTINPSGFLEIGTGGTTGSIAGNVIDNGELYFNRSDAVTYNGTISGNGQLIQQGTGTLTVTGNNTGVSDTGIQFGSTLSISSDNNLGPDSSVIYSVGTLETTASFTNGHAVSIQSSNSTTFKVDAGVTTTQSGLISPFQSYDTGGVSKSGTGNLILTNNNTYLGGTTISSGTLYANGNASSTGRGAIAVNNGGTLSGLGIIAPTGTNAVTVTQGGTIAPGGVQPGATNTGSSTPAGNLTLNTTGITSESTILSLSGTSSTPGNNAGLTFALGSSGVSSELVIAGTGNPANTIAFDVGDSLRGQSGSNSNVVTINDLIGQQLTLNQEYVLIQGNDTTFTGLTLATSQTGTLGTQILGGLTLLSPNVSNTFSELYPTSELFLNGDSIELDVIPEPGESGLLLLGLGMLIVGFGWRRKPEKLEID